MEQKQPHGDVVIFKRAEVFYPIQLMGDKPAEEEAAEHAKLNPGTLSIETIDGRILWAASRH